MTNGLSTPGQKIAKWLEQHIIDREGSWSEDALAGEIDAAIEAETLHLAEAIKETIAEIKHWHADMLEPEERNHPRGNGWARVYDRLNAVIAGRTE